MRHPASTALGALACLLALLPSSLRADSPKPVAFGPYMLNHAAVITTPGAPGKALTNGTYRFQIGWIEPISELDGGLFKDAYFEVDGDFNVSPWQSDLGTTFNLKPIRYLEVGLSYNRLMFHNSLRGLAAPGTEFSDIPEAETRPAEMMNYSGEFGGGDVFTFQANLTFDFGPFQAFLMGARSLWDVDFPGKDFIYEYSNDMVIKPRDRINYSLSRLNLDLSRFSRSLAYSFTGLAIRNQYWISDRTNVEKNLVSAGVTGLRLGRNPQGQRRGLDLSVGLWTLHPHIDTDDWVEMVSLQAEWRWNVQFLRL